MVDIILQTKQTGVGFNGEVVLFNERLPQTQKATPPQLSDTGQIVSLCESLKHLGVQASAEEVKAALTSLFSDGPLPDESQLLRQVYRHFRQQLVSV